MIDVNARSIVKFALQFCDELLHSPAIVTYDEVLPYISSLISHTVSETLRRSLTHHSLVFALAFFTPGRRTGEMGARNIARERDLSRQNLTLLLLKNGA
jgi:hypothetical protein